MKKNSSAKLLYLITALLVITTLFLSFSLSFKNSLYLFFLVFAIAYWQKKRLQDFFQKIKNPKASFVFYILTGWLWAIFLEFSLGLSPFHPRPITNYLVGLGFYLPYFTFWLVFIERYQFTIFEVFYLGGLGKLLFDLLISRKLLISAAATTHVISTLLVVVIQAIVALVLFGVLTTLPVLYLKTQEDKDHNKPLKEYLIGLTPGFLATGVFILWMMILKAVFT